jgi:hypothetical protein
MTDYSTLEIVIRALLLVWISFYASLLGQYKRFYLHPISRLGVPISLWVGAYLVGIIDLTTFYMSPVLLIAAPVLTLSVALSTKFTVTPRS